MTEHPFEAWAKAVIENELRVLEVSAEPTGASGCFWALKTARANSRGHAEADKRALVGAIGFHMGEANAKGHAAGYDRGYADAMYPYPPEHARKVLEAAVELARARAACKCDNIDPVSFRTDFSRFQAAMRCEHEMFVAADALLREMEKGPKP